MQVTSEKKFSPVTILLETQAELDYLTALSNTSIAETRHSATSLNMELTDEAERVQMPFYDALQRLNEGRK